MHRFHQPQVPPTANGKYFQKNNSRNLQKAKLESAMKRQLLT